MRCRRVAPWSLRRWGIIGVLIACGSAGLYANSRLQTPEVWLRADTRTAVYWRLFFTKGIVLQDDAFYLAAGHILYVLPGVTAGNTKMWFGKFSPEGELRWNVLVSASGVESVWPYGIAPDGQGGIVFVGAVYGDGTRRALIGRIHSDGQLLWAKVLERDGDEVLFDVAVTPDGDYLGVGRVGTSAWVIRFTRDGVVQWQRIWNGVEATHAIVAAGDDQFYVMGPASRTRVWIARIRADGSLIWQRAWATPTVQFLRGARTPDGGLAVAGWTWMGSRVWLQVLRIHANGDVVWYRRYGPMMYIPAAYSVPIVALANGDLLVFGVLQHDPIDPWTSGWVGRLDARGEVLLSRRYDGDVISEFHTVIPLAGDRVIAAGMFRSGEVVARLDGAGWPGADCHAVDLARIRSVTVPLNPAGGAGSVSEVSVPVADAVLTGNPSSSRFTPVCSGTSGLLPVRDVVMVDVCPGGGDGDGNGVLEPGEYALMDTELINLTGQFTNRLQGYLSAVSPELTVLDARSTWTPIPPGTARTSLPDFFRLHVDPMATCSRELRMALQVTDDMHTGQSEWTVPLGKATAPDDICTRCRQPLPDFGILCSPWQLEGRAGTVVHTTCTGVSFLGYHGVIRWECGSGVPGIRCRFFPNPAPVTGGPGTPVGLTIGVDVDVPAGAYVVDVYATDGRQRRKVRLNLRVTPAISHRSGQ